MHVLASLGWHLTLALAGALLIHWVAWQAVGLSVGVIMLKHGVRTGYFRVRRRMNAAPNDHAMEDYGQADPPAPEPALVTMRLPMVLIQLFGAQCALCHGLGCRECAQTGLC